MKIEKQLEERVNEVIERAVSRWTKDDQLGMCYEECGELIAAINQYRRGRIPKEDVIEEIADVYIMLNQLLLIVGAPQWAFSDKLSQKLSKVEGRLGIKSEEN